MTTAAVTPQTCRALAGPLAAGALALTARRARAGAVGAGEERVFRSVNRLPDELEKPLWAVMQTGSLAAVLVSSGALAHRGKPHLAASTLVAGVGVWGGVKLVKPLIGRGRPGAELADVSVRGQPQTGLGYPSGHAAVALTLALVITRSSSGPLRATARAAAAVTGLARMYVGAHLPLDIAGGMAIGWLSGRVANAVSRSLAGSA